MTRRVDGVMNSCFKNHAERQGAYRLLNNKRWKMDQFLDCVTANSAQCCKDLKHVLCIQDTTEFTFDNISGRLNPNDEDYGYGTNKSSEYSIFAHPCLLFDPETETPMGYSSIELYNRDRKDARQKKQLRKKIGFNEKESSRWAASAKMANANLPENLRKTMVGDRENDIYTVMSKTLEEGCDFLIRSIHNRLLEGDSKSKKERIIEWLDKQPVSFSCTSQITRQNRRKPRKALFDVKYAPVTFGNTGNGKDDVSKSISCHYVHVREDAGSVPEGEKPIEWRLLTSHEVKSKEDALRIIQWYKYRWHIEEVFRLMKTKGLGITSAQLENGMAMKKLMAMGFYVVLKCMTLKKKYDTANESVSCNRLFTEEECEMLHLEMEMLHKESPRSKDGNNPFREDSLAWASWIIARLGSWKAYVKSGGPPGYNTICKGLKVFHEHLTVLSFMKQKN
ncbi:IS4 family transposase [Porphyromonas pogonae]|uniref:IS4 family transposase n=1 Tax=Porphyromonas pogonae TaxID=867595 RepID=UPI002E791BDD|nr:IS4 family transposase [Porphyromonas pogonae]